MFQPPSGLFFVCTRIWGNAAEQPPPEILKNGVSPDAIEGVKVCGEGNRGIRRYFCGPYFFDIVVATPLDLISHGC